MARAPMAMALLISLGVACAQKADIRVCAIRSKSFDELKSICTQAQVPFGDDDDAETLRAALYAKMQTEIPGSPAVQSWPGPGTPGECEEIMAKGGKSAPPRKDAAPGEPDLSQLSAMLFKRLDTDSDGKLSRTEMQGMIDNVNAEAERKGEPTYDLFNKLDQNRDSFVDREESDEFFKAAAGGGSASKSKAPTGSRKVTAPTPKGGDAEVSGMADGLFSSLDGDKDGLLSKEEFEPLRAQWAKKAEADGEAEGDFFTTLDSDNNAMISKAEMIQGLMAMTKMVKDEL